MRYTGIPHNVLQVVTVAEAVVTNKGHVTEQGCCKESQSDGRDRDRGRVWNRKATCTAGTTTLPQKTYKYKNELTNQCGFCANLEKKGRT